MLFSAGGTTRSQRRYWVIALGILGILGILTLWWIARADAAGAPSLLWQAPEDGLSGAEAGRLDHPNGVAVDPATGHVYVADRFNSRVSEFDAWGQFVRSWTGTGTDQLGRPQGGVAFSGGDLYVGDMEHFRVEKFDPAGNFLLMFGGGVNETTGGNVCTAASGDVCRSGTAGEGDGEFTGGFRNYIAPGPSGTVFVGGAKGRIQQFEPDGTFKAKVILEGELGGGAIQSLATDPSGNFYVVSTTDNQHIYKFDATGKLVQTITLAESGERALATDSSGNLYAKSTGTDGAEVVEFDSNGGEVIPPGTHFALQPEGVAIQGMTVSPVTSGGAVDIYVASTAANGSSYLSSYGPAPDLFPTPLRPPDVVDQFTVTADPEAATVKSKINPRFWADTVFYVEYGTGHCFEGRCTSQQPAAPGVALGAGVIGKAVTSKGIQLGGLVPGTTYHFRFVAQSSGGGPVHGVGPSEAESTFTTPALPQPSFTPDPCPNAQFRTSLSARLTDCRAYEMVSPVDKDNGDIIALINVQGNPARLDQSSVDGDRLAYSAFRSFGDEAQGAPFSSQYLAERGGGGWSSRAISPAREVTFLGLSSSLDVEFRSFTEDLCSSILFHDTDPPLAAGAPQGFPNIYRRQNCGEQAYEALTTSKPPTIEPEGFTPDVEGVSKDGRCAVFKALDQLTPDANPGVAPQGSNEQVYESCGGALHLISVLPNGKADKQGAAVGTGTNAFGGIRYASVKGAVSDDGSRVYWTGSSGSGPGTLYVRVNAQQDQSKVSGGVCTEPEKACTLPVSGLVSNEAARFWQASPDGSRALFVTEGAGGGGLYEYDLASGTATLIAREVPGIMGASTDLSRVYLVSRESLATGATAGQPNLYLAQEGGFAFIATLTNVDSKGEEAYATPFPISNQPIRHTAQVSADGLHLAFMSTGALTGFNNTDVESGEADTEVYRYDASANRLDCVSCNPSGTRPSGRFATAGQLEFWASGRISASASQLFAPRVLSRDGSRLFFDSYEPLVQADTNGKEDVYEWEAAGSGNCTLQAPSYSQPNGGCLSLISSGTSPSDSEFLDASPEGTDVFFTTDSSLLPQDPGLVDIYDARVNGGFPTPTPPPAACEGEACQPSAGAPAAITPASATFEGAGNLSQKPVKKKHKKKRHKQRKTKNKPGKGKKKRPAHDDRRPAQ